MTENVSLDAAVRQLLAFLGGSPLTETISKLEYALEGKMVKDGEQVVVDAGVTQQLLEAALTVRRELGRVNDLIHATAIVLSLPHLLESDERILRRPSLAAGNDPTRPFDLETDRRIAEFKLSQWDSGSNAMRKRQTFKDLVALALDGSSRLAQLFVIGTRPKHFLQNSKSTAAWALDRSPGIRERFVSQYGTLDIPIHEYSRNQGAHVRVVNLAVAVPHLFSVLASADVDLEEERR